MKKMTFMATMAIAATLASCGGAGAPKESLKSDVDSVSYALGVNLGEELNQYNMLSQMGVDSAYVKEFLKGVNESANAKDDKAKMAYYAGIQIGNDLNSRIIPNMEKTFFPTDSAGEPTGHLNRANLLAALFKMVQNDSTTAIKAADAQGIVEAFQKKQKEAQYKDNREAGEKFLAENKTKEGVITTESGLQYKVVTAGTGALPVDGDKVKVLYEGRLVDGKVFDSNWDKEPITFGVNQVISGWTEALKLMPVGSEWEIYVPQELGYGEREGGPIPPYSALIFKVKLLGIEK